MCTRWRVFSGIVLEARVLPSATSGPIASPMIVAGFFIRTFMGSPSSHWAALAGHLYDSCRGRNVTVDDNQWLARRFEEHRTRLRAVAYRMLGSLPEAEEAVQDAWLRLSRSGADGVENMGGWLTTIVARVCLNALQARKARPEQPAGLRMPDPVVSREDQTNPEQEALLAASVGLALLVVLEMLDPAERLAFVLHDMFDLPFEEIAPMVGRSPTAVRQLASRARRKVQGAAVHPIDRDVARQREVVDAFFAAGRAGDFDALVRVLHPDVVLRSDVQGVGEQRGATRVARM